MTLSATTRSRPRTLIGLTAITLLAAGCSSGSDSSGGSSDASGPESTYQVGMINQTSAGDPVDGGTLTMGAFSEPRSLDPANAIVAGSTGGIEMAALYDVLLRWDSARNTVEPQLAESMTANDDATAWTLKLRDGVTFSDGTPLDAAAVKSSIERYIAAGADEAVLLGSNVTAVDVVDPLTVQFTLASAWPTFDYMLTTGPGMVVAQSAGGGDTFTPIGAGAFTLAEYKPTESITLTAREDYWDGAPPLESIRVAFLNNPEATYDSFNGGELDAAFIREPDLVDEALAAEAAGYLNLVALGNVAVINAGEGRPGADPRVRQAIAMAIDPNLVIQRAYNGAGIASSEIFPDFSIWHTDETSLPYDPEAARKLLDEAKADGYDGQITHVDGMDPASRATALAIKGSLEAIGFQVEIDLQRTIADQVRKVAVDRDYDMSGWGMSWREAGPYGRMFATLDSEGNATVGMPTSPEMDALIAEFQGAATEDEQREIMGRIQEEWNTLVPAVVFAPAPEFLMWSADVHGVTGSTNSIVLLDDAWVG